MWWKWQTLNLTNRLTDMGGPNTPPDFFLTTFNLTAPGPEWTDYDGDDGNSTTLNHVLYFSDIYPNVTVGDVMDATNDVVCAEYYYSDSFNVTTTTS
jgi:tyrosinase